MNNLNLIIEKALEEIQNAANSENGISGLSTGYKELDRLLNGLERGDLIVIGGRPSMGKTQLLINLASNMAKGNVSVLFYSYEMTNSQIIKSLISKIGNLEINRVKSGRLLIDEEEILNNACKSLIDLPLYIVEDASSYVEDLINGIKENIKKYRPEVIIIDYIQLLRAKSHLQNRYEEISFLTRELKNLARELNIPIIISSQLNRNTESREDKKPQIYDLRDSGSICEDANVVMLLHRPEYYTRSYQDSEGNNIKGLLNLSLAKNHMGPIGDVRLKFDPSKCLITEWTDSYIDYFRCQDKDYNNMDKRELEDPPF